MKKREKGPAPSLMDFINTLNPSLRTMMEELSSEIKKLGQDIGEAVKRDFSGINYKVPGKVYVVFCGVKRGEQFLWLWITLDRMPFKDPENWTECIPDSFGAPEAMNKRLRLTSSRWKTQRDYALSLVKQAYDCILALREEKYSSGN